jgi:hypothetical protein
MSCCGQSPFESDSSNCSENEETSSQGAGCTTVYSHTLRRTLSESGPSPFSHEGFNVEDEMMALHSFSSGGHGMALEDSYAREALMGKEARRARVNFTQTYIHIICDIFRDLLAWKDRKHNQHLDTCITSISTTDDVDKTRRFKHHVIFRHQQFQATQAKTRVP